MFLAQRGRFEEAEKFVRRALKESHASDATFYNYGCILQALRRPQEALQQFSRALAINPAAADSWNNRGTIYNELGHYREAIADFDKALAINPKFAVAYCNKAKSLGELKSYDQALAACDRALSLEPKLVAAWSGRGAALSKLTQLESALEAYNKVVGLQPMLAAGWLDRASVLSKLGRPAEARESYDRALSLDAGLAEAWLGIGNILTGASRFDEAFAAYDRALAIKPDLAEAWLSRGNLFGEASRFDEAFAAYDRALAIKPDLAEAWLGRGEIFVKLGRERDAHAAYNQALALQPDLAAAWLGHAKNYNNINMLDAAAAAYGKALVLQPNVAGAWAWAGRASVFEKRKQYPEALAAYDKALAIKPDIEFAESNRLHIKQYLCDWSNFEHEVAHLVTGVREHNLVCSPFGALSLPISAAEQFENAKRFVAGRPSFLPLWRGERYAHDRIRIAYISSDLRDHPVGLQMVEVFEQHDKSRFELTAISLTAAPDSDMRARIKTAFDHFVDAETLDERKIAEYIRQHEIDIVVDLNGFTTGGRPDVLARRAAPIQVNFLGFLGTMGAPYIDYIIADRTVIPENDRGFYSEKVVYMPNCFQPTDRRRVISDKSFSRAEAGLPDEGFVFCSFNSNYKFTPTVFDIWMRLLKQVDGSVLWLVAENPVAEQNLKQEALASGVIAERLIFAPRIPLSEHQARLRLADLFLDTWPYNAGATASDTLWAGVPVVTRLGDTFIGRMAASVLTAISLPELIVTTPEAYEALAFELATNAGKLAAIKQKLAENRLTMPLFDTKRYTRDIEAIFTEMYEHDRTKK